MDFLNFNKIHSLNVRFDKNGSDVITALDLLRAIEDGTELVINPESDWFTKAKLASDLENLDRKPSEISPLVTSLTRAEAAQQAELAENGELGEDTHG